MSKIKTINNVSKQFWDDVIARSDHATFFHTYTWAKIITRTFPQYSISTKGFILEDGTRIVLPLLSARMGAKGFCRSYESMVPGVYGGIVSDGRQPEPEDSSLIFKKLTNINTVYVDIFGNPFSDCGVPSFYVKRPIFTQILRLEQDSEIIWSNYKYSVRKQIRKAERNKVQVHVAGNLNEYEKYFEIYENALKRWGDKATSRYRFDLFADIHRLNHPDIKLWLVSVAGKIVGGTLVFYCNTHAVEWHAAFRSDYFRLGIRNYLVDEIIKDACQKGYEIYDFSPSGGHEGVVRFKESFGAERLDFSAYSWTSRRLFCRIYRKFGNLL
jgi:lipid II:glycine glycyltransferase (peptidoglycan interpeptide bridge formation enzyme)